MKLWADAKGQVVDGMVSNARYGLFGVGQRGRVVYAYPATRNCGFGSWFGQQANFLILPLGLDVELSI